MGYNFTDAQLRLEAIKLEQRKYAFEVVKWLIAGIAAVVSFWVLDVGRLKLEEFRYHAENQRLLLQAYLSATEAVQPDVWKRKLRVIQTYSTDDNIKNWANKELQYIDDFAERDALYRETLKVASQLVDPKSLATPGRQQARARFEQLYWADLPYADESSEVAAQMIVFRNDLMQAEAAPSDREKWEALDGDLILLSRALKQSQPKLS